MLLRSFITLAPGRIPASDDSQAQSLFDPDNGSFAKTVIGHMQRHPGARYSVALIELASQPVESAGDLLQTLSPALYSAFIERIRPKWHPIWREDRLDQYIALLLPDADQDVALERLCGLLVENCRYSILADRQCHAIRWRVAAATYPNHGHAPWRLLRHASEQMREAIWSPATVGATAVAKAA